MNDKIVIIFKFSHCFNGEEGGAIRVISKIGQIKLVLGWWLAYAYLKIV